MLRTRKNKRYNEEAVDEDDDGGRRYNLKDKISSKRFETLTDLQELPGDEVTLKLIQRNGFDKPILVTAPAGLDLTAPPEGFVVRDVGKLVGYDRLIDVMDVRTQKNIEMTMKDWCKYYESRNRDRLLNVISLEFSHTDLDDLVDSPKIIKQLDWVDLVWPKFLKESQTESTNKIDNMKYPKVQKYCLMSVKGSYTDFHIDFGGTSVWYHIIRGKKIFWMVPPTELSLQTFEEWTLSGMQQDVFFGDTVEQCFRVELTAGNTFFIPSGWIHAVYTVEDSLVFGGNFLHSFGIENQLKVARIEDATKVPLKFRYPFYTEMLWYVVQHYVHCLTGRSHMHSSGKNSAMTTPEKATSKATMKNNKPSTNAIVDESATESEQDDCDKTSKARKKTAATQQSQANRKRGRPPKKKPVELSESPIPTSHSSRPKKKRGRPPKRGQQTMAPTDEEDESTEIDDSDEESKPPKTNTCRMTKNSLLRLQYEIDEPQVTARGGDRQVSSASDKCSKSLGSNKDDNCLKVRPTAKMDPPGELQTGNLIKNEPTTNNSVLSDEASMRPNGWSSSHVGASKTIWSNPDSEPKEPTRIHITKYEVNGLKILVKYLSKLSGTKKHMPCLIRNAKALLDDCKKVIVEHENDDPELAITGIPITQDLLNVKRSDINQLIEQFFKPETVTNGDAANNNSTFATKSDSSTLTMQQRLKYNQAAQLDQIKVEDKKNSSAANDNVSQPKLSHKEIKGLSPNKKSTISSGGGNATSNNSAMSQSKSSPSKPLSNKQFTSKTTKSNDKAGASSLDMPDMFAGLIAATSNAKGVFSVSSADVTSSLFGPNSTSKINSGDKDKVQSQSDPLKPISIDISKLYAYDETSSPSSHKDNNSPKPTKSPEPPKLSPTKRFITPSQNKIQPKERLIFASAPYVSPVFASEQSRYKQQSHSWQNSTPLHDGGSQQHAQYRQSFKQVMQAPEIWDPPQQQQQDQSKKTETPNTCQPSSAKPTPDQTSSDRLTPDPPIKRSAIEQQPQVKQQRASNHQTVNVDESKSESTLNALAQRISFNLGNAPQAVTIPGAQPLEAEQLKSKHDNPGSEGTEPKLNTSMSVAGTSSQPIVIKTVSTAARDAVKQPQKEPRGPPKKSKEARRVIELDQSLSSPAEQTSVIKANTVHDIPIGLQSSVTPAMRPITTTSAQAAPSDKLTLHQNDKTGKPKAKRVKNSKDLTNSNRNNSNAPAQPNTLNASHQRPSVISGLVAAPISSSNAQSIIQPMKPGQQQYLISRPMLYNGMPNYPTTYMQHMVPASMPVFTASMPNAMGMHNVQPGARIVWARPQAAPVVGTSTPAVAPTTTKAESTTTTTKTKKQSSKPTATMPTNMHIAPPDNAALLSLATTALSTAPLPTNPTLSTFGASQLGRTFMANPMFAPQHYFNPYMQPMPMMHFAPRDPNHMTAMMAAGQIRPGGIPVSQAHHNPTTRQLLLPISTQPGQPGQPGQPRYLITQPGFMAPRAQVAQMFTGHQFPQGAPYAAFQSPVGTTGPAKESAKVKKVKTR